MHELTKVERDRLAALTGMSPYPPSAPRDANERTEANEIEFRTLSERAEREDRLEALRKQPARSRDELLEMEVLGAPADEVAKLRQQMVAEEAKEAQEAQEAPREGGPVSARDTAERDRLGRQRAGDTTGAAERAPRDNRAADDAAMRRADQDASAPARARAESERLSREAAAASERQRADHGDAPANPANPVPSDQMPRADAPAGSLASQRMTELRAIPNRTPEQNAELARLEGSPG